MNILFVFPTRLNASGKPVKYRKAFLPPLALAVLNALTPDHHNVQLIDDIVEDIDFAGSYDLVAITAMTMQVERAYQIADAFRDQGFKVIMGGMHPTVLPQEAKQHADSIVIGEADNIWEQILDDCENNVLKDFYQDTALPDLQRLVIPKWDNLNLRAYPKRIGAKLPMMPIFTTRGCPLGCKFCSVTKFFGKTTRVKPISHVIQEIESTGATEYLFVDDNITCNPDYSRALFGALAGRNLNWVSQISTTVMKNPDLIDLAAKAGCTGALIGVESLSQPSLKTVNKGFNRVERYEEMIQRMQKNGINPCLSFIFGFDEDTPDLFRSTVDFCKKNKIGISTFWILTPLPGTALFAEMEAAGRIEYDNWSMFDLTNVVFQPKNFSKQQLYDSYWKYYQELLSTKNIFSNIWHHVRISNKPARDLLNSVFIHTYFRRKVYSYDHPMTGGIGRITQSN
jgi:radical SAM superfamily enzyme YgiQ (UPF0313 family)